MKTSSVWKNTKEEMQSIIDKSSSIGEVIEHLGLARNGNYQTFYRRVKQDGLDIHGLKERSIKNRRPARKHDNESMFVEHSNVCTAVIKRRIIKDALLPYECSKCHNKGQWEGQRLSLQLDHKNGVTNDNRMLNLRFLCPNCHSQTETFCSKNRIKKSKEITKACIGCNTEFISKYSLYCGECRWERNSRYRKVKDRPSVEVLTEEINKNGFVATGRKYGVSDNSIRKWLKWG